MKFTRTLRGVGAAAIGAGLALAVATPAFAADEAETYQLEANGYHFEVAAKLSDIEKIEWKFATEEQVDGSAHKIGDPVQLPNSKNGEEVTFQYTFTPDTDSTRSTRFAGTINFIPEGAQNQVVLTFPQQYSCNWAGGAKEVTLNKTTTSTTFECFFQGEEDVEFSVAAAPGEASEDASVPSNKFELHQVEDERSSSAYLIAYPGMYEPATNADALARKDGKIIGEKKLFFLDYRPVKDGDQGEPQGPLTYETILTAKKGERVTEPFTVCLVSVLPKPGNGVELEHELPPLCETYNPTVVTAGDPIKPDSGKEAQVKPAGSVSQGGNAAPTSKEQATTAPATKQQETQTAPASSSQQAGTLADTGSSVGALALVAALLLAAGTGAITFMKLGRRA